MVQTGPGLVHADSSDVPVGAGNGLRSSAYDDRNSLAQPVEPMASNGYGNGNYPTIDGDDRYGYNNAGDPDRQQSYNGSGGYDNRQSYGDGYTNNNNNGGNAYNSYDNGGNGYNGYDRNQAQAAYDAVGQGGGQQYYGGNNNGYQDSGRPMIPGRRSHMEL